MLKLSERALAVVYDDQHKAVQEVISELELKKAEVIVKTAEADSVKKEIIDAANKKAGDIKRQAYQAADVITADARDEADEIIADAEAEYSVREQQALLLEAAAKVKMAEANAKVANLVKTFKNKVAGLTEAAVMMMTDVIDISNM